MASATLDEKAIFNVARQIDSPDARLEYLRHVCGADADLLGRVETLLRAYEEQASFLESPPAGTASPTIDQPPLEKTGAQIGPYKLLQQIGEGGMGTVWMAQQTEPVRRLVAVKLIKAGMDMGQVIARFEAERQALALMDHVNIARVLDAGTTASGRPYFVMDLVRGVPITKYCDEHHLTPRQRLELFIPVCQAIQHAHQKGIIHRDIKPSNVLVALYDGKPVPKVIDFGVAKATGQSLTDKTLDTGLGNVVGTLEYMSPEQAEINQLDIDTRSDIYSLGVLLYELLAGSPPFTRKELEKAGILEMLRVIREEEPSKPSMKLSTADGLSTLAANRGTEPARLAKLVRGELDWIVMKALEKDRNRRYETANGFAMDLQRYLNDEAVHACPPSAGYRLRKFAKRNKGPLMAGAMVVLVLLFATTFSAWQAVRATHALAAQTMARKDADNARQEAKDEAKRARTSADIATRVSGFLTKSLLSQADPQVPLNWYNQPSSELRLITVLNRASSRIEGTFKDQPLVEAGLRQTIGDTYRSLGDSVRSAMHLRRAAELRRAHYGAEHPETLITLASLALTTNDADLASQVLELRRRVLGKDHVDTVTSMLELALVFRNKGESERAILLHREALAARQRALGEENRDTALAKQYLAYALANSQSPIPETHASEIEAMYRQALATLRNDKANDYVGQTSQITLALGGFLIKRQRYEDAETVLLDGIEKLKSVPAAPSWLVAHGNELDRLYTLWGPERAAKWQRQRPAAMEPSLQRISRLLSEDPDDPELLRSYASLLVGLTRYDEAAAAYRAAIAATPRNSWLHQELGDAYVSGGKLAEAEAAYREAIRLYPTEDGRHHHLGGVLRRPVGGRAEAYSSLRSLGTPSGLAALRRWPYRGRRLHAAWPARCAALQRPTVRAADHGRPGVCGGA